MGFRRPLRVPSQGVLHVLLSGVGGGKARPCSKGKTLQSAHRNRVSGCTPLPTALPRRGRGFGARVPRCEHWHTPTCRYAGQGMHGTGVQPVAQRTRG